MFGPRATAELNWQAHDPATLVTNLRGMKISLWTGNGDPGPLDHGPPDPGASAIEDHFPATRLPRHLQDARMRAATTTTARARVRRLLGRDLEVRRAMMRTPGSRARPTPVDFLSAADRWRQGLEGIPRIGAPAQPSPSRTQGRLHPTERSRTVVPLSVYASGCARA
jgi:hypothetical protein